MDIEKQVEQVLFEAIEEINDQLPEEFASQLDNVFVTVEETPSTEDLEAVGMAPHEGDELLGLYHGTALGDRHAAGFLAEDVFAGSAGVNRHGRMPVVG